MVGGYGYAFDLPEFPQTFGAEQRSAPEAAGFELGQNGYISQQQNPHTCPRVGSSAAAFYATEAYMGLSRYDLQENNNHFDQDEQSSYRHTQISRNQFIRPNDHHPYSKLSENEHLLSLKEELLGDVDDTNMISPSPSFVPIQDLRATQYVDGLNQFGQQPAAYVSTASGNNTGSHNGVSSSKTRIRWTQELHDRFVDRVNRLGGPDKARPKAILQLMDTEGLTIFHIKSHLQKFRNVKYVPESGEVEGRSDKRNNANKIINMETGLQIREALQLQLDVQMRLHEQLEVQRKLQLSIEEQGKKLKMMLDQQQKTAQNLMESTNSITKSTLEQEEEEYQEEVDENCFPIKIK